MKSSASYRRLFVLVIAGLALLPMRALHAQDPEDTGLVSFFATVGNELADAGAFAIDARSFSAILRGELNWDVTPEDIEDLVGPEFRYGPIDRFVTCEQDVPCQMAYPGTHIVLLRVAADEERGEVSLRLGRTGGADGAVWRGFESITVRRVEGAWQVVDR
ncbi:MAG: hypothetical protein KJP18_05425 [Gemmatimonadetes bacterium]|nr:hypothetical protein [Gemmatimonadota bacterium]NNF37027.1 hypothetical protein [Gemmatimonadota bacterium]